MIRLFVVAFASMVLAISLFAPLPTQAWHQHNPPWLWYNYFSFNPTYLRDVGWRACATTNYEEDIAYIAFNNWVSRFGHDTGHMKLLDSCNTSVDSNLRVWARAPSNVHNDCNDDTALACYIRKSYDSSGGNSRIYRAYIVFDYWYFDNLYDPAAQMHIMAHEFGHGMGLADPHACFESVMSHAPCEDMVDNGPYPNDVCVPDSKMGYGNGRC